MNPIARNKFLSITPKDNELIIQDLQNQQKYRLDLIHWRVWELLDGTHSVKDIGEILRSDGFKVDTHDVWEILDFFADADLLVQRLSPPTQTVNFLEKIGSKVTSRRKLVKRLSFGVFGAVVASPLSAIAHPSEQNQKTSEKNHKTHNREQANKEELFKTGKDL